jgi:predicted aspartyl protease
MTIACRVSYRGFAVPMEALVDTGANSFVLVHPRHLSILRKSLRIKQVKMKAIPIAGFDSQPKGQVDCYFKADLVLDGHRINTYFVICDTGRHDLIIGRKLLSQAEAWVSCKKRKLQWPEGARTLDCKRDVQVPLYMPRPSEEATAQHQADAERREALFEAKAVQREVRGRSPRHLRERTEPIKRYSETTYGTIQDNTGKDQSRTERLPTSFHTKELGLDILAIGAAPFRVNAQRPNVVIGHTSIYEVDQLIDDKRQSQGQEQDQSEEDDIQQIMNEKLPWTGYAGATKACFSKKDSDVLPPHREGIDHKIELLTPSHNLSTSPLYSMSIEQLQLVKDYLEDHLRRGVITHSNASYASPVLFAKKPGGGWRFCVDYRKLNELTKKDVYPIPLIEETLSRLSAAKVFTKLDVRQAFYRIRMDEAAEDLTTFRTRYGNYKYRVLPFGLCNGPATFQRYINKVLHGIVDDFCSAYLDDVLIFSEDPLQHEAHVAEVLRRLRDAGLQVDIKKSEFAVKKTKYLGLIISTEGIQKDLEKTAPVANWKPPTTLRGLQSYLGFCNYYRQFMKDFGRIARPLTLLLKKGSWRPLSEKELEAFKRTKELLLQDTLLAHYSPHRQTRVETDASDGVVAGVLSQLQDDGYWKPVAFFTKTMDQAQMNYGIHDKEMLAVMLALREWRHQLIGLQITPFQVITDHRALEYFSTKRELTARQMHWATDLAEFHLKLSYRPGTANIVADALSRKQEDLQTQKAKDKAARTRSMLARNQLSQWSPAGSHPKEPQAEVAAIAGLQELAAISVPAEVRATDTFMPSSLDAGNPEALIDQILEANRTHGSMKKGQDKAKNAQENLTISEEGLLLHKGKLVVPEVGFLRTHLIRTVHATQATAHPGQKKTLHLLRDRYYWPSMRQDVEAYVAACKPCRWSHAPRDKTPGLLKSLPVPERAWQDISIDFKSMPPDKKGFDNVMVVVDRLGKRCFSLPCHKTVTAEGTADLYYKHIWRVYGPPRSMVSDRGPQFISSFMDELCRLTGVKQKLSTAHHPQTDGQTEIVNQYLDQRLRPFVNYHQDNWSDLLPSMDWAQAILPHQSTGLSPYEVEFGHQPRYHWDWQQRSKITGLPAYEKRSRQQAQAFAKQRYEAVKKATELSTSIARQGIERAQKQQATQANKKRREPNFGKGDMVYLTPKDFRTGRPSSKLDQKLYGPYPIKELRGHSYQLELPASMKIHDVFHADRLRKAAEPIQGQEDPEQPPIEIDGEPEWTVQEILDSRVNKGRLQYRAAWTGFNPDLTWYNALGFKGAPYKVRDFHVAYLNKPGPLKGLSRWIEAYKRGKKVLDYEQNGGSKED